MFEENLAAVCWVCDTATRSQLVEHLAGSPIGHPRAL